MELKYGKEVDLGRLKKTVLSDLTNHRSKIQAIIEFLRDSKKPVEQTICYICKSPASESDPLAQIYGFSYIKCRSCGHVYTTSRYSDEDIQEFYKTNRYWSESTYANKETSLYRREHVNRPKFDYILKFAGPKPGTWIDVGAGIGDLISVAIQEGWKGVGLELSDTSVKFSKEFFNVDLEKRTFEDYCRLHAAEAGTVDVVSCMGLLEHTFDPLGILWHAKTMLKKGGLVAIQVPNGDAATSMLQALFPENVFRHMSPCEHFMLFTKQSLTKACALTGFEPLGMWFHGMDIYELLNHITLLNPKTQDSAFYKMMYENMNELQYVLDRKELSDRIICVARSI